MRASISHTDRPVLCLMSLINFYLLTYLLKYKMTSSNTNKFKSTNYSTSNIAQITTDNSNK